MDCGLYGAAAAAAAIKERGESYERTGNDNDAQGGLLNCIHKYHKGFAI